MKALALLCALLAPAPARAYEPISFRAAARSAPIILLAQIVGGKDGARTLRKIRTLRGEMEPTKPLGSTGWRPGTIYLMLLNYDKTVFSPHPEYLCGTVNMLEVVEGTVPRDRFDRGKGRLTLAEVEAILAQDQRKPRPSRAPRP